MKEVLPWSPFEDIGRAPGALHYRGFVNENLDYLILKSYFQALKNKKKCFFIFDTDRKAQQHYEILQRTFHALSQDATKIHACILPHTVRWRDEDQSSADIRREQRMSALFALCQDHGCLVFTTPLALLQKGFSKANLLASVMSLTLNDEIDLTQLTQDLDDRGYQQVDSIRGRCQYSYRGNIVDIFSPQYRFPVRMELFSDTIISIRDFAIDDQRSKSQLNRLDIIPRQEWLLSYRNEQLQPVYDYFLERHTNPADRDGVIRSLKDGYPFFREEHLGFLFRSASSSLTNEMMKDAIVFWTNSVELNQERTSSFFMDAVKLEAEELQLGKLTSSWTEHFADFAQLEGLRGHVGQQIFLDSSSTEAQALKFVRPFSGVLTSNAQKSNQIYEQRWEYLGKQMTSDGTRLCVLVENQDQEQRTSRFLKQYTPLAKVDHSIINDFKSFLLRETDDKKKPAPNISIAYAYLPEAVFLADQNSIFVPYHQLFPTRENKPSSSQTLNKYLSSLRDLTVGSFVVHVDHGIGKYLGLKTLNLVGLEQEYLQLEYAGGDKLYLPVDRVGMLQKYQSGEAERSHPRLDKLNGSTWQAKKQKARKTVRDIADQLLKLYAKRSVAKGTVFPDFQDELSHFQDEFPYQETDDQLRAIADVMEDMSVSKPMDRLVCGDVGFGKTEVAIRACYRAILAGYQVMILAPTTVLCFQHFRTFSQRLTKFGIQVAQMNRFVGAKEQKETIEKFNLGKVDVIVGTHRLLSKDIHPHRLGLLVVDEEQRFGVAQKEKIKEIRAGCDVLTLTATPIPRTLHLAMLGLRDISVISTAPKSRLPVQTIVHKYEDIEVKKAIEHEVSRGGQVFYLHNRVASIEEKKAHLQSMLPNVSFAVAHAQLPEESLEAVIMDFIDQKFAVLICTSIIESGIDMPNVNTLIVDRADMFGLSQLYQLRGRVGRSSRQAYAYFFVPSHMGITEDARERLHVLQAYQELGSGFQIASHDLDLRGAGTLLGAEQAGKISDVGVETYTDMLHEEIARLRNEDVEIQVEPEIKWSTYAMIPSSYVIVEADRLALYRKIFTADNTEDLSKARESCLDRYGALPHEVNLLFEIAKLKTLLRVMKVALFSRVSPERIELTFAKVTDVGLQVLLDLTKKKPLIFKLAPGDKLLIHVKSCAELTALDQIERAKEFISLLEPIADSLLSRA